MVTFKKAQSSKAISTDNIPLVYAYAFDHLGFELPTGTIQTSGYKIQFIPFQTDISLDSANGLIIPSGVFETITNESDFPYSSHAPIFPSLFAEGRAGGGYDVEIPLAPVAIFLQFKIPQVVRRRSDKMPHGFSLPYLRMHLRTKRPNQHRLLRRLEASGHRVFYVTPGFYSVQDLDENFCRRQVHTMSCYFEPSAIGPLNDQPHHVAYRHGDAHAWLLSKPNQLDGMFGPQHFGEEIDQAVIAADSKEPEEFFREIAVAIARASDTEPFSQDDAVSISSGQDQKGRLSHITQMAHKAAYLSQVRLGCTLIITGKSRSA